MARFRHMPEWEGVNKDLAKKLVFDEATIARIAEEGDSLDFVEVMMSLEEAFPQNSRDKRILRRA